MSHKKTWACMKPDGDGCDGDHSYKLDLKYGEQVRIKETRSELDGLIVRIAGVCSRNITDTYIVELLEDATRFDYDGNEYSSFAIPEGCLERI